MKQGSIVQKLRERDEILKIFHKAATERLYDSMFYYSIWKYNYYTIFLCKYDPFYGIFSGYLVFRRTGRNILYVLCISNVCTLLVIYKIKNFANYHDYGLYEYRRVSLDASIINEIQEFGN